MSWIVLWGLEQLGVAYKQIMRNFTGIERYPLLDKPVSEENPDYFNLASKRIQATNPSLFQDDEFISNLLDKNNPATSLTLEM